MKILVKMTWIADKEQWYVTRADGSFIYDLFNCATVQSLFETLDKKKAKYYTIEVKECEDKNKDFSFIEMFKNLLGLGVK